MISRFFTRAALAAGLGLASLPAEAAIEAPRPAPAAASTYNGGTASGSFGQAVLAHSKKSTRTRSTTQSRPAWSPPRSSIVMDFETGTILSRSNEEELRHPASLAKVMTLMLAFDALRDGRLKPGQELTVSAHAAARPPVKLGLKAGDTIKIEDAMLLVATKSTNDMAAVIAEAIAGTEDDFAVLMTAKARSLGMDKTVFKNASGLPHSEQVTTALDMALMTRHLIQEYEAEYDEYIGRRSVTYNGQTYTATNRLQARYQGMDGVKTGYINASGFNLIASAERKGRRIIGVIFGGTSAAGRDNQMIRLLDDGFKHVNTMPRSIPIPMARPTLPQDPGKTGIPDGDGMLSPVEPVARPAPRQRSDLQVSVAVRYFALPGARLMP
jgi:D-alanyl-D-alanine carboxypeptidase